MLFSWNLENLTSCNSLGHSRPVTARLYLHRFYWKQAINNIIVRWYLRQISERVFLLENVKPAFLSRQPCDGNKYGVYATGVKLSYKGFLEDGKQMKMLGTKFIMYDRSSSVPRQTFSSKFQASRSVTVMRIISPSTRRSGRLLFSSSGKLQSSRVQAVVNCAFALQEVLQQRTQKTAASSLPADGVTVRLLFHWNSCSSVTHVGALINDFSCCH